MSYDRHRHHRRSIRQRGYDYSQAGTYFITICTQGRACLFGEIVDGKMLFNATGRMVDECWNDIPAHFPHAELDEFVVMPNHVHGILSIIETVGAKNVSPLPSQQRPGTAKTIGSIIRGFKIGATKWIRANTDIRDVWQRNYYEHIIRDDASLNRIRQYIMQNPARWAEDFENPENVAATNAGTDAMGSAHGNTMHVGANVGAKNVSPLHRPDIDRVIRTIREQLTITATSIGITPLQGDASNRRYYRVSLKSTSRNRPQSLILMHLADPEGFKQSEEAISTSDIPITELPFVNVHTHLRASNLPVPRLHYYDRDAGLLYLEDLGDVTLEHAVRNADQHVIHTLYTQAIDILIAMHTNASRQDQTIQPCIAFGRMFDVPLLMWEFDHFLEYGIVARNRRVMCANDFVPLREEFQKIAELIASQQRVFTHRDYHSRNLMLHGNQIGLLDFQDALMGPAAYDVASLLRDAYIQLDEELVEELVMRYITGMPKNYIGDVGDFRRIFDFTSIQRNLKAAGRFVYIDRVKRNPKFLADISRTLGYVKSNLQKYPELNILHAHLAPYVPELS